MFCFLFNLIFFLFFLCEGNIDICCTFVVLSRKFQKLRAYLVNYFFNYSSLIVNLLALKLKFNFRLTT